MKVCIKRGFLIVTDSTIAVLSYYFGLLIRFDGFIPHAYFEAFIKSFFIISAAHVAVFYFFGLHRALLKYTGISELTRIFFATLTAEEAVYLFGRFSTLHLPRSVYVIAWLQLFILIGGMHVSYRIVSNGKKLLGQRKPGLKRVMIIGAGDAGSMLIKELLFQKELKRKPVLLIDDDMKKHGSTVQGIPVRGCRKKIGLLAEKYRIDEIIMALPSASQNDMAEILSICKETRCTLKKLPGFCEMMDEEVSYKHIRDVKLEDLLGRDEVRLNTEEISDYLKGETVLVTGGGGSIGSELCRQIARFNPGKLIVLDIYENCAYELQNELLHKYGKKLDFEVLIGSVRDTARLRSVFSKYRPGVVFHAAAHKHVPLMEANPAEAIKNNVIGTLNAAECASEFGVKRFVLISTDKAVNPTSVMGASKRMAEMIVQSMNRSSSTRFAAVRFGNVLGSSGSVIPLFRKQIEQGGPVTVTHPNVTRFFMTIPEAAQLVIQAGAMANGGEIFILDMGKPIKIADLARDLIRLSGLEPDIDIRIEFTGLRPGEKLFEELLLSEEEIKTTPYQGIFVGKPLDLSFNEIMMFVKALENCIENQELLIDCLKKVVPTYRFEYRKTAAAE